ncbi:MAG: tRNA (adenosine(37)-N6)-threonylcarbamoyltransferase complex ATPase subunit type 1 TsaE [Phycisphaerae bacterium]|nr:tRNA (adenosine(37)-N6)-threonylcarbamoyltransferase complex ATPase subunit type 1 TsaE [Phycisphaerae bacterium]
MTTPLVWTSHSPEHTLAFGERLGRAMAGGDVLALSGPLGSGKTQLVKGLARGLEIPADEPIVSPTFVLVREYAGRLKLYHIDAYRLGDTEEFDLLGLDEMYTQPDAVVAIEWADRFAELLPATCHQIELEHAGESDRRLTLTPPGDVTRLVQAWLAGVA